MSGREDREDSEDREEKERVQYAKIKIGEEGAMRFSLEL